MDRQRKKRLYIILLLLFVVIAMTVAFAALSTTLNIRGTARFDTATWEIKFANLSAATLTGAATVTTEPTIQGTGDIIIGDYEVVLTKPGDSVTYTFDVENNGTVDAKIGSFTKAATPTFNGLATDAGNKAADEALLTANTTYTLTYTADGREVALDDTLEAGVSVNMTLKLAYDGTAIPTDDVEISGLDIAMIYVQN